MPFEDVVRQMLRERGFRVTREGGVERIPTPGPAPDPRTTTAPLPQRREGFDPTEATPLPGIVPLNRPGVVPNAAPVREQPSNAELNKAAGVRSADDALANFNRQRAKKRRQFTPAEQANLTRFGGSRRRG